jgi:nucleoside phosphorylase
LVFVFKGILRNVWCMGCSVERPFLVVSALEDEIYLFGGRLEGRKVWRGNGRRWWSGRCGDVWCVAGHLGVGADNAAAAVKWALENFSPTGVLLAGYAGGLRDDVVRGDVFTDDEAVAGLLGGEVKFGGVVCVPKVLESEAEKREWASRTGALVCEMESVGVRDVCARAGVGFFHLRVVSDAVGDDFPEAPLAKACDFGSGRTTLMRLLWHLLRRPRDVAALVKLFRKVAPVRRRLCEVVEKAVPAIAGACAEGRRVQSPSSTFQ